MRTVHRENVMERSMSWVAILVLACGVAASQSTKKGVRATAEQKVLGTGSRSSTE